MGPDGTPDPYLKDRLTYRGKEMVEFETLANTEGLGTRSRMQKNGGPVRGVVIRGVVK